MVSHMVFLTKLGFENLKNLVTLSPFRKVRGGGMPKYLWCWQWECAGQQRCFGTSSWRRCCWSAWWWRQSWWGWQTLTRSDLRFLAIRSLVHIGIYLTISNFPFLQPLLQLATIVKFFYIYKFSARSCNYCNVMKRYIYSNKMDKRRNGASPTPR